MAHRRWEKKMSEFKDLVIQMKHRREKCWGGGGEIMDKSEQWDNFRQPKMHMQLDAPQRKSQIFKEIFAENFLILMKTINSQICNKP